MNQVKINNHFVCIKTLGEGVASASLITPASSFTLYPSLKRSTMPHALTSRDSAMESKPLGSYQPSGIDVLIVGTGLAGLVAALECVRKGHTVRVLEKNGSINTNG